MKQYTIFTLLILTLVLAACNKEEPEQSGGSVGDGETSNQYGAIEHGVKEGKDEKGSESENEKDIGFQLTGDTIEEAENVPAAEKKQILAAFDAYMTSFNAKDLDRYLSLLSSESESFNLEEERAYLEQQFAEFDIAREASDTTIVKYVEDEKEAHVFSKMKTQLKQRSSKLETEQEGRQVTVFKKESGQWKVTSVHYLGENGQQS